MRVTSSYVVPFGVVEILSCFFSRIVLFVDVLDCYQNTHHHFTYLHSVFTMLIFITCTNKIDRLIFVYTPTHEIHLDICEKKKNLCPNTDIRDIYPSVDDFNLIFFLLFYAFSMKKYESMFSVKINELLQSIGVSRNQSKRR